MKGRIADMLAADITGRAVHKFRTSLQERAFSARMGVPAGQKA